MQYWCWLLNCYFLQYNGCFGSWFKYSDAKSVSSSAANLLLALPWRWHASSSETNAVWRSTGPWRTQQSHGGNWQHSCPRCSTGSNKNCYFVVHVSLFSTVAQQLTKQVRLLTIFLIFFTRQEFSSSYNVVPGEIKSFVSHLDSWKVRACKIGCC